MNHSPPIPPRRSERITLNSSYAGEAGRGISAAAWGDFAMLVSVSHFGVANRWLLGMLGSAPYAGYVLSLFSAPLAGLWRKKSIVRWFEVLSRLLLLVAAGAVNGGMFIAAIVASSVLAVSVSPLITGIYGENFRTAVRGEGVGRLQILRMGCIVAVAGGASWVLARGTGYYRLVLSLVGLVSLGLAIRAWRLPETRRSLKASVPVLTGLGRSLRIFVSDPAFMVFELCWFLLGLGSLAVMPLRVLYLRDLGFSDRDILLCTTVAAYAAMLVTLPLWGRILYRMNFAVYRVVTNLLLMAGVLVFFRAQTPLEAVVGSALLGSGWGGGSLAWRLVATFFTGSKNAPAYQSVHTFLCGIRGVIGPMVGIRNYGVVAIGTITGASLGLMALSTVMVLGLIPVLARRRIGVDHTPEGDPPPPSCPVT